MESLAQCVPLTPLPPMWLQSELSLLLLDPTLKCAVVLVQELLLAVQKILASRLNVLAGAQWGAW